MKIDEIQTLPRSYRQVQYTGMVTDNVSGNWQMSSWGSLVQSRHHTRVPYNGLAVIVVGLSLPLVLAPGTLPVNQVDQKYI